MTGTGATPLSPGVPLSLLAVGGEMAASFLYVAVILALGVSLVSSDREIARERRASTDDFAAPPRD